MRGRKKRGRKGKNAYDTFDVPSEPSSARKRLKRVWRTIWSVDTAFFLSVMFAFMAVCMLLTKIPPLSAPEELATASQAESIKNIIENPVDAPHKLATYALTSIAPSVRAIRAVSFVFLLGTIVAMFYMLKHWHKLQTAILTTCVFASNAIVLATGRLGMTLITVVSFYTFAGLLLWHLHSRSNKAVPIMVLIALGALLYIPGFIWFALIIGIVYWGRLRVFFKHIRRQTVLIGMLLALLVLAPLILGFARNPDTLKEWLLLPQVIDSSQIPRSILRVPSAFIYRMPEESLINVGRLPVFDVASGLLFLVGFYAYLQKLKLDRTRVMIGSGVVAVLVGAFGQTLVAVILLLPFVFSIIAAGIEFLLDQWFSVFPRNPFARSFGVLIVTITLLFSMYYQLTRFFVVWPQTPETRATYNQSRIIDSSSRTDTIQ